MAQKKSNEVDAWLRRPDPGMGIVLIYGPDRGLVSERARLLVKQTGLDADDPFSVVRLDADELEASPGRLREEADTVPMFADKRLIWIKGAGSQKQLADEVKALAASPARDTLVLIEGGDLKKGAGVRAVVEAAASAMALPCYADEGRSIDTVIDEALSHNGLSMASEARQLLRDNLGGDRLATRSEIDKLVLYCHGMREIGVEDVMAMVGDVSSLNLDDAVDGVLIGNASTFDATFSRLLSSGTNPFLVLSSAMRQFHALQLMRRDMDANGRTAATVVAAARPPIFFARRKTVEAALQKWTAASIARALERLQATVLLTRRRPDLAAATARQALIALVVEAARAGR